MSNYPRYFFHYVVCVDVENGEAYIDLDETMRRFDDGSIFDNGSEKFVNPDMEEVELNDLDDQAYVLLNKKLKEG